MEHHLYNVTVTWGDGNQSIYSFKSDPTFTISHNYKQAGNYVIKISVKDLVGSKTVLQLVAIIHSSSVTTPVTTGTSGTTSVSSSVSKAIRNYSWVAWPSYFIVVALVFSFWLGEREEIRIISRRNHPARR